MAIKKLLHLHSMNRVDDDVHKFLLKKLTVLITIISICLHASPATCNPLKVGDRVPEYTLKNIVNYPKSTVNISEFKGKLLILDFWNSGCGSCIASWPKLQGLQEKFGEKIQILLVNPFEDKTIVTNIIQKRKKLGIIDLKIPSVCKDTALLALFAVKSVPHIIWIDQNGIVRSITYSESINEKNITAILNNQNVSMPQKEAGTSEGKSFDPTRPFFTPDYGYTKDNIIYQSSLGGYNKDVMPTLGCYADEEVGYGIFLTNAPIKELYKYAYSDVLYQGRQLERLRDNRIIMNVKDTEKYTAEKNGETMRDHLYSYQLTSSRPCSRDNLQKMMQQDLFRYFGLNTRWITQTVKCLIISTNEEIEKHSISTAGKTYSKLSETDFIAKNITLSELIHRMQASNCFANSPFPIVNESTWTGKISEIIIETDVCDIQKLTIALNPYGIVLNIEERQQTILEITE